MVRVIDDEDRTAQARELAELLVRSAEESKAVFTGTAAEIDLPVPLARAIVRLSEPAPMRELADDLACDRSYITNLADQLEERGLVDRVTGTDRRIKLLRLTAQGQALREKITRRVSESALVLRRLDDDQRAALRPLLEALLDSSGES